MISNDGCGVRARLLQGGLEKRVGAGLDLAADVNFRGGDVADEDGGEAGSDALGSEGLYFFGDFGFDLRGDGGAVEDPGHALELQRIIVARRGENCSQLKFRIGHKRGSRRTLTAEGVRWDGHNL